jgi:sortase (surface protein transpeptidase)
VGKNKDPYRYYEKDHPYLSTLSVKKRVDYKRKQRFALAVVLIFLFFLAEIIILWGASNTRVAYSPLKSNIVSGVRPPKAKLEVKKEADQSPPPPILKEAEMYLVIPKLLINTPLEAKGTAASGEILTPSKNTSVSWFKDGVKPGQNGSVLMAGYYGSENAGILKDANKLTAGDEIEVRYKDGRTQKYKVLEKAQYQPNEEIKPELLKKDDAKYLGLFLVTNPALSKIGLESQRLVIYAKSE